MSKVLHSVWKYKALSFALKRTLCTELTYQNKSRNFFEGSNCFGSPQENASKSAVDLAYSYVFGADINDFDRRRSKTKRWRQTSKKVQENQSLQGNEIVDSFEDTPLSTIDPESQPNNLSIEQIMQYVTKYLTPDMLSNIMQQLAQFAETYPDDFMTFYSTNDRFRHRIESLLKTLASKLSDKGFLISVNFIVKVYASSGLVPLIEFDNSLVNRSRSLDIAQVIKLCNLLKPVKKESSLSRRMFDLGVEQCELRFQEITSIEDVVSLMHLIPYLDRLMLKLNEQILALAPNLSASDWIKILYSKAVLNRRDRTVIKECCHHISRYPGLYSLSEISNILFSCAHLQIFEYELFDKCIDHLLRLIDPISSDTVQDIDEVTFSSIITSLGILRIRHIDLLDTVSNRICISNFDVKTVSSMILTLAHLNYSPSALLNILKNFNIDSVKNFKRKTSLVWSLIVLERIKLNYINAVLNDENVQSIYDESNAPLSISTIIKLIQINTYAKVRYVNKTFQFVPVQLNKYSNLITVQNKEMLTEVKQILEKVGPVNELFRTSVLTQSGLIIDFLFVFDLNNEPQNLKRFIRSTSDSKNKLDVPENFIKVAVKCVNFSDKTLYTEDYTGTIQMHIKLLNMLGYHCVLLDKTEFSALSTEDDKEKYVWNKLRVGYDASVST